MLVNLSAEQHALRETLRRYFRKNSPGTAVRSAMASRSGFDHALWRDMSESLSLMALRIPESYGGLGLGFVDLEIVFEEMGRALVCAPYLSTVALGVGTLLHLGSDRDRAARLPALASGKETATLAVTEQSTHWDLEGITTIAEPDGAFYRLTGKKSAVLDGCTADLVLVAARLPGTRGTAGLGVFALRDLDDGVRREEVEDLDPTRRLATLELESARAAPIGTVGQAYDSLVRVQHEAMICIAAEAAGGAARCLEQAVEYAKLREQFGRAIGSFQAIKHMCAEMYIKTETAAAAAQYAAWAVDSAAGEAGEQGDAGETRVADVSDASSAISEAALLAKTLACDAYRGVSADNIHIHGGIGFTWDHDAQLYFKRAASLQFLLGESSRHRQALARHLEL